MAVTLSKYGSSINRLLCHLVGLSTDTKPIGIYTDKSGKVFLLENGSSFEEMDTDKKYLYDVENQTWNLAASGGGGGSATLIEKSITENGVYNASDDSADGYSKVTVDVANSYTQADDGKVVSNGSLVAQTTHAEITENGIYDITTNNSVSVNVSATSENNAKFKNAPTEFNPKYNLVAIEIPEGVTKLAGDIFRGYTNLEQIILPSTLQIINTTVFMNCTSLTAIEIPSNVQIIDSLAFIGCTNLTTITVHKPEGSISNAPWGATNATVIWDG